MTKPSSCSLHTYADIPHLLRDLDFHVPAVPLFSCPLIALGRAIVFADGLDALVQGGDGSRGHRWRGSVGLGSSGARCGSCWGLPRFGHFILGTLWQLQGGGRTRREKHSYTFQLISHLVVYGCLKALWRMSFAHCTSYMSSACWWHQTLQPQWSSEFSCWTQQANPTRERSNILSFLLLNMVLHRSHQYVISSPCISG